MSWNDFLVRAAGHATWSLVGPLYAKGLHRPTAPTIYVDGGLDTFDGTQKPWPVYSLGDGDSLRSAKVLDEPLPKQKNFSDLQFALTQLPNSVTHLEVLGFLGGRRDHEWIGLGEIYRWLTRGGRQVHFDDGGILGFAQGQSRINLQGLFSILTFEEASLSIQGHCLYALSPAEVIQPFSSRLLSNEGTGEVEITSTRPWFIFKV